MYITSVCAFLLLCACSSVNLLQRFTQHVMHYMFSRHSLHHASMSPTPLLLIIAGRKGPSGEAAVLGLASADDKSGNALYVSVSFGMLDISVVDHLPEELVDVTIQGLTFGMAFGIGPEGTFQRMQLSVQSLQIDDQLSASRYTANAQL